MILSPGLTKRHEKNSTAPTNQKHKERNYPTIFHLPELTMNYHTPTVSAEVDSDISRYNILNYCSIISPGKICSIVVSACYTCRMRGHQQYQAKLIVDGRCILRGGCKNTNEEALAGLYYWLQRRAEWKAERFHG
ncbi:hypothetical protein KCU93_g1056, partial [Aureobasidium melanogenum]